MQKMFNTSLQGGMLQMIIMILLMYQGIYNRRLYNPLSEGSCNHIGSLENISYYFNNYYELHNQSDDSCNFDGLGMITIVDPSIGDCRFLVATSESYASNMYISAMKHWIVQWTFLVCTLTFLGSTL